MAKKSKRQQNPGVMRLEGWPCGLPSVTFKQLGALVAIGRRGRLMEWTRILAYITGTLDQELLLTPFCVGAVSACAQSPYPAHVATGAADAQRSIARSARSQSG